MESFTDQFCSLTPWDLSLLSLNYIQWGLLFSTPSFHLSADDMINCLKTSLSTTLSHFCPLAGRFLVEKKHDSMFVSINCCGEGIEFIHAIADNLAVSDVLAPLDDVPSFVSSFFPLNEAINYEGHFSPLLSVQVTELADGIFMACSFNHAAGDGVSFHNFLHTWAEICRTKGTEGRVTNECHPSHSRWFLEGVNTPIKLPFSHPDEFIGTYSPPPDLRERFFHLSSQSIAHLKSKANAEIKTEKEISSFQALCSLVWRSVTRARCIPADQKTRCNFAADNRARLQPPLPADYFGNAAVLIGASVTVGELLSNSLGWGARLLQQSIIAHTDERIRSALRDWLKAPVVHRLGNSDAHGVTIGSSPRFDLYGCDFGWGKAVALRSGSANKHEGKVSLYQGQEGRGSVDLEVCLPPAAMAALLADAEFIASVS